MPGKKGSTATSEKPRKAKKAAMPKVAMPKGNAEAKKPQGDRQWDMNRNPQNTNPQTSGKPENWQERQPMNTAADPNRRTGEEVMEHEDEETS